MTFIRATKGEFGLSGVDYRDIPERVGRLLHGIYEACGSGTEENGGSVKGRRNVSHTDAEVFTALLPRAPPFREKAPDRSSTHGLALGESFLLC